MSEGNLVSKVPDVILLQGDTLKDKVKEEKGEAVHAIGERARPAS